MQKRTVSYVFTANEWKSTRTRNTVGRHMLSDYSEVTGVSPTFVPAKISAIVNHICSGITEDVRIGFQTRLTDVDYSFSFIGDSVYIKWEVCA